MKRYLSFFMLSAAVLTQAQTANLILNSEFDKPLDSEFRYDAAPGVVKREIFTEDRTWNRCLRIEVLKYAEKKQGKVFYTGIRLGGNKTEPGFRVKPNTVYSFSMELKGTLKGKVGVSGWTGTSYWKDMKRLKITGDNTFSPAADWTVVKGTFQTAPGMKYAAVGIDLWGEARYKNLPPVGGYVMIDKVKVTEKAQLFSTAAKKPAAFSVPLKKAVVPGKTAFGFVRYKTGEKAAADTEFTVAPREKDIVLNIRCHEPVIAKLKKSVTGNGGNVWKDDLVEIFFGPAVNDRTLSQFAVSAGGGRWMGRGDGVPVPESDYARWSAKTSFGKDFWTVEAVIPYELLGWKKRPAPGTVIPFNLCRGRTSVPENTSYSFAPDSFHNTKNYAVLWLDDPGKWFAAAKAELSKAAGPDKTIASKIIQWQLNDPAEAFRQAEIFRKEIAAKKLGNRTFAVTPVSPASDPSIPMIPAELAEPPEKIRIRAAGNEFKALPLAITNLLDRAEEYRIVIASCKGPEEGSGLKRDDGKVFPADRIRLYRGIRVKDSDAKGHGLRYDPLAPMDITSTVVVMPKEAAPVWAILDTAGIEPGIYRGIVRVIPLGQAAVRKKGYWKYTMTDLPLEFEVLPFEISRAPAIPQFFFGAAYGGRDTFRMMMEHDINTMLISPWRIKASFNPDGSLKSADTAGPEREIMNLKQYAREMGMEKELRIGVAYSAYLIFRDVHARKKFKCGTPEWKKAWQEYVRVMNDLRKKCGIPAESCFVEIQDEPKPAQTAELIAAAQAAKEAAPELNLMLTVASWKLPMEDMKTLGKYIDHWCFWGTKYFGKDYAEFLDGLRKAGKVISLYSCDTSLRLDLQKYYITHAWRALAYGTDMCCLYEFMTHRHAVADWKQTPYGSTALVASGKPVSTIRLECLRIGSTDIKYLKKLAEVLKLSKSADPKLRGEIEKFLKEAPVRAGITMAHDPKVSAEIREKAIDYILKLR